MILLTWRNLNINYLKNKKTSNPTRLSKVKKCYWTAAGAAVLCLCCTTPAMAAGGADRAAVDSPMAADYSLNTMALERGAANGTAGY